MRNIIVTSVLLSLGTVGLAGEAAARPGCIKGAIVGGIAGHLVGHGGLGAAAGCAYGVHERHNYDRQQSEEGRSSSVRHDDGGARY
ncbi:MAG: hypothetical protein WDN46_12315 [Methylocella sp.]